MKLTFLGTAAAEGFPAVFCNCEHCKQARKLGGKNIRTRSQSLINNDLLIDLPADTYHHFLENGILGDEIKYLFITHSHQDHLYPGELQTRKAPFAHNMSVAELNVYCSRGAYDVLSAKELENVKLHLVKAFEPVKVDGYEVVPLPANHFQGDDAVFYIIKGEKTVLYAHDTGYFYEEVFEYIEKENIKFDFCTFDCTSVELPERDIDGHMAFENIGRVITRLKDMGAMDDNTISYVNHFSHNGNPLHENLERIAKPLNLNVSYDGLEVEF